MADKAIVDKAISDLTQATQITGDDLFVLEQSGEAKKLKGSQVVQYAKDAVAAEVQGVKEYADTAKASADAAAASATKAANAAQGIDDKVAAADASAKAAASSAAAAAASATGVDEKVQAAQTAADNAAKSETAAKNAQTAAANAQKAAESAQTGAQAAKTAAESAQEAAESAKDAAAGSSTAAGQKATQAAQSAEDAASAKSAAETAKTDAQAARDAIVNMIVEAVTLETGKPATVSKSLVDNVYKLVFGLPKGDTGAPGPRGATGNGISGIALKSGNHAPGTSDVYTITLTDGTTYDFAVYNGANGAGAGDMLASIYDPQGKRTDVYKYVDDELKNLDGLSLSGGILSVGYRSKSVAMNPAINGLGFALNNGATIRAFYDNYEMEVGNDTLKNLFDGEYGSYVNFVTGVGGAYTWDKTKQYPAGAYVRLYRNSRYEWYKATKDNIGIDPLTDASGTWVNKNVAETGTYASFLDLTGVSVALEITFPTRVNLRYENSVALYWRASGQNASHIKIEKYDEAIGWFAVFDQDSTADDIITNVYLGKNAAGATSSVQNKIRLTFRFRDAQKWCCLNQIAFSGIVGGIEGTLLNRGGGTMYGGISPYTAGGASLGSTSAPWKEIRGQYFYGDISNAFSKFSPAISRELLTAGETLAKSLGKVQKWFTDLGALAFKSKVAKADLDDAVKNALIPSVTTADNGKFLRVENGKWAASEISSANGGSF